MLCEDQQVICQFFSEEDFLYAADEGDLEEVRSLLEAGVDIFTTNKHGFTALHKAAQRGMDCTVACAGAVSRGHGMSRSLAVMMLNSASSTGLDLARSAGHHKVVAALLAEPGATKLVTMQIRLGGSTALHLAAEKSHFNVVQEILQVCSSPGCWLLMPLYSLAPRRACADPRVCILALCLSACLPPSPPPCLPPSRPPARPPCLPPSLSLSPSL